MSEQEENILDQKSLEKMVADVRVMTTPENIRNYSATDLNVRLELLESYWGRFSVNALQLQRYADSLKGRTYFKENKYAIVLESYLQSKAAIKARILDLTAPLNVNPPNPPADQAAAQRGTEQNSYQASLERIKLTDFDGNQHKWEDFKENFDTLVVRDTTMDPKIKYQRLANCLTGEPAQRLKGISSAGRSFETAWSTLCRRYDNQTLRFSLQMRCLIELPRGDEETATHLNLLLNTVNERINTFKDLKRPVDKWDDILNYFVVSKMAKTTRLDWMKVVERREGDDFATYEELKKFLEDRISTLDIVEDGCEWETESSSSNYSKQNNNSHNAKKQKNTSAHAATQGTQDFARQTKCSFCGENHFIALCNKFSRSSQASRREHVKTAKLYFNCLNSNHSVADCQSKGRCLVCNGKHHTRLHRDDLSGSTATCKFASAEDSASIERTIDEDNEQETSAYAAVAGRDVLMATACVTLEAPSGQRITVRALLDTGAEESFVTEHLAQMLSLPKKRANVVVSGVGGAPAVVAKNMTKATVKSERDSDFSFEFSALILKSLTTIIPRTEVRQHVWPHLTDVCLADPHFGVLARIDCILSSEVYAAAVREGIKRGPPGTPTGIQTVFGWVLMGAVGERRGSEANVSAFRLSVDHKLSEAVARLWELQEVPEKKMFSQEEEECMQHFKATHSRNETGRFVVRLPFVKTPTQVDMRRGAESCFKRLETRFERQPHLAKQYKDFMSEYLDSKHMEKVPREQVNLPDVSYFPHHPVFKKDNPEKIRVVFNASQKNERNESFNSYLHVGPKLQEDILILIVRWSFFPIAFTCDIVKMFRQFMVHADDVDWQRIFWRESKESTLETYRLLTVTYGTASAPFLANACMLQLADDVRKEQPIGAAIIEKARYADDFLAGGETTEDAYAAAQQLIDMLKSAGMSVGKWGTNEREVLRRLGLIETENTTTEFQEPEVVSTLVLQWIAQEDSFKFRTDYQENTKPVTKRLVLSETAKLYDPIGWLEPVIVRAKMLIQDLWLQGHDWDTPVSPEITNKWRTFCSQLKQLEDIRIPRWCGANKNHRWSIHGFSDASERAYAATVFIVVYKEDEANSTLTAAKSKVAPTKVVSLPKLELCGASLLADLLCYILAKLDEQPEEICCWTDSKVVLAWLTSHPSRWKTFIANRVSGIKVSVPTAEWRHVKSADNPADLATRGLTPDLLKQNRLWWKGPEWLCGPKEEWPIAHEEPTTELEIRRTVSTNVLLGQASAFWTEWLEKFSSVDKITRILAYVRRWRSNASLKADERRKTWLSAQELACGTRWMLRLVQREAFVVELETLKKRDTVLASSSIRKLSPFVDLYGFLRVEGRLQHSFLTENEKHPIILPSHHHVSRLIIERAHRITLHGGQSLVQSLMYRQYWLVKGRNMIRSVLRKCVVCTRHHASTLEQKMGPLPAVRTRPARPFTFTEVNLCGPFLIKASPGRGIKTYKGYAALFICLVVRAVHIEIVSDLTSAAFLAAFKRFTGRRGLCKRLYSDNASNFQGADAELQRLFTKASAVSQEVAAAIARDGVKWSFIPPRAPNFGGLWEANIKSFKRHLKKVIAESKLTYEEFTTVATMIEACLNSRPLSKNMSAEIDAPALTPGHFLIGAPLVSAPEPFVETNESITPDSRWHSLSLMRNHFWKRWHKEFLVELQQRAKWLTANEEFKVGDVVLFKDNLLPPTKWPLAKIIELRPGADGLSRVAVIKTERSEFVRPVNKLVLLPVNESAVAHLAAVRSLTAGGEE